VSTKGTWYPDRTKATDKDPPLYLHISATTKDILQKGIDKVNDVLSQDLGPLIEDRRGRDRERVSSCSMPCHTSADFHIQRKWPEEKVPVAIESLRNFNVRAKVVGPQASPPIVLLCSVV
jgi:hypothetical protein